MVKASCAAEARRLTDIPNIGLRYRGGPVGLGLTTPAHVKAMDPFETYDRLRDPMATATTPACRHSWLRMTFTNGGPARPWWYFSPRSANSCWVVKTD